MATIQIPVRWNYGGAIYEDTFSIEVGQLSLDGYIDIDTPPSKLNYVNNETIDYTGMIVKSYHLDGTVWDDEDRPQGVIPNEELTLREQVAKFGTPNTIKVVSPPSTTIYSNGQTIDFTGMTVCIYDSSGTLWSSTEYPNGVIPINELTLRERVARFS